MKQQRIQFDTRLVSMFINSYTQVLDRFHNTHHLACLQWLIDRSAPDKRGYQPLQSFRRHSLLYHQHLLQLYFKHSQMAPISTTFSTLYTASAFAPSPTTPTFNSVETFSAAIAATDDIDSHSSRILTYATTAHPSSPDDMGHQLLVYIAIIAAITCLCMTYTVVKRYFPGWCLEEDECGAEKMFQQSSFRSPVIALPPPSAAYGREPILIPPPRPAYISTNDLLRGGRSFFR
ncbi:hypothetical protein MSAN_00992400 [Mycena sanguinolenta]|uniref:Uncharacterized protein n=1 Tax=Mycena sanguinolenta TaxID=230812 RepID=A0A8H6YR77_9AGAR|nr:hypothetical protein MSAN_00992400 [Mycena sanguinolenta]